MPHMIKTSDKPNSLDLHTEVCGVHLDYLAGFADKILAAGAFTNDDGGGGHGGLILLDVDDRESAEAFIAGDPFSRAGLFESVEVSCWRKAFFNFEKLI